MKELTELILDAEVTGWVPTEAWADLILEASVCYGDLSGVISCVDYDLAAGNGDSLRVRVFPSVATVACKSFGCQCLSKTSTYLQYANIPIYQWGIYNQMCAWSLWNAKGPVKEGILNEMAKALAATRDYQMLVALGTGNTPYHYRSAVSYTSVVTLGGNCCDYRFNIYNSIVSIAADMRAHCVNPDIVIMRPEVAKWFYIGDRGGEHGLHVKFDANDKLLTIANLKVIETGHMRKNMSQTQATIAYIIDSSRAIGEAWGMRPTFTEQYDNVCNMYDETVWMYWGTAKVTQSAVGYIWTA